MERQPAAVRLLDCTAQQMEEYTIKGQNVHKLKGKDKKAFNKDVQIIFQDPMRLRSRMTVAEIIGEGIEIHELAKTKQEKDEKIVIC